VLGDVETESLTIDVTGNSENTFDIYCVKLGSECLTNGSKYSDILNITGLTAGTNYTFHVYTVWQGVLSERNTPIQTFTSKKSIKPTHFSVLLYQSMGSRGLYFR